MKKKILFFVAIIAIIVAGIITPVKAEKENPECPNGCVGGSGGCYCYSWYEGLREG